MTDLNDDQRAIVEECDAIKAMLLEKNKNYGSSALDPVRVFSKASSVEQILVRLDDKLSRLARGNEADEDVTLDILGYLVLLRIARRRQKNDWSEFQPKAVQTVHLMKKMRCGCPSGMTLCGINALEKLIRGQGTLDPEEATCVECKRVHDEIRPIIHLKKTNTPFDTWCGELELPENWTYVPTMSNCNDCKKLFNATLRTP
jgi:hypothetical protein